VDWEKLFNKEVEPPYKPVLLHKIDYDQRMKEDLLVDILPKPSNPDAPKDTTGYTNFSFENQSILQDL
jgi:hypothetical protein